MDFSYFPHSLQSFYSFSSFRIFTNLKKVTFHALFTFLLSQIFRYFLSFSLFFFSILKKIYFSLNFIFFVTAIFRYFFHFRKFSFSPNSKYTFIMDFSYFSHSYLQSFLVIFVNLVFHQSQKIHLSRTFHFFVMVD